MIITHYQQKILAETEFKNIKKIWARSSADSSKDAFKVTPVTRPIKTGNEIETDSVEYPITPPLPNMRHRPETVILAENRERKLKLAKAELNAREFENRMIIHPNTN